MRVLHILDHSIPLHSGYTFRTRAIIEQQRALGWDTYHVTGSKHTNATRMKGAEEDVEGLHFYRTAVPQGFLASLPVLNQWAIVRALEERLKEIVPRIRPDILHAHSPALNGEAAIRVGKRFRIPVVYEIRAFWEDAAVDHGTSSEWGLRYRLTRALETSVIKRAAAVTTICEGLRNDIVGRGVSAAKVTVIPNAVDTTRFRSDHPCDDFLAQELGLQGKRVVGFIGSFYAYEGLSLLLRALSKLLKRCPEVRVLLVGGGPEEDELKRYATEMGISDKVIFTGRVPHDEVQAYYNLIHIFVYPRLPMRLTELVTPLKPLEAMAQRRLVVASDVGGHRELIRDGETGVLFHAGDPQALAEAVLQLLDDESRWPAQKDAGRLFVESERNWPVSVGRYKKVYADVLEGRG